MKKHFAILISLTTLAILATSCKDETTDPDPTPQPLQGQLSINIATSWMGSPYDNTAIVQDNFGNRLRIENFTSYLSNIAIQKTDGTLLMLEDYYLAHFANDVTLSFPVPLGEYSGIQFLLGVPADVNTDTDPAQYPNTHPLSVPGSQGMFWNWNTGYIFTKLEGKADTTGTNEPLLYSFAYHTGDDHSTATVELLKDMVITNGQTTTAQVNLNIEKIFMPENGTSINLAVTPGFHSPGPAMNNFVANFSNAFEIE